MALSAGTELSEVHRRQCRQLQMNDANYREKITAKPHSPPMTSNYFVGALLISPLDEQCKFKQHAIDTTCN